MEANPYSTPSAHVDTSPRKRRPRVTGNETYFRAANAHMGLAVFAGLAWLVYGAIVSSELHSLAGFLAMAPFFLVPISINVACWWGCKNRQEWARIITLVLGFLSLFMFPIGTIVGIFLIRFTIKEWPQPEYYDNISLAGMPGQPEAVPPPLPPAPPPMPAPTEAA